MVRIQMLHCHNLNFDRHEPWSFLLLITVLWWARGKPGKGKRRWGRRKLRAEQEGECLRYYQVLSTDLAALILSSCLIPSCMTKIYYLFALATLVCARLRLALFVNSIERVSLTAQKIVLYIYILSSILTSKKYFYMHCTEFNENAVTLIVIA